MECVNHVISTKRDFSSFFSFSSNQIFWLRRSSWLKSIHGLYTWNRQIGILFLCLTIQSTWISQSYARMHVWLCEIMCVLGMAKIIQCTIHTIIFYRNFDLHSTIIESKGHIWSIFSCADTLNKMMTGCLTNCLALWQFAAVWHKI